MNFKEKTTGQNLQAKSFIANYGGIANIAAENGQLKSKVAINIKGTNPSPLEVRQYLSTKLDSAGFDKIIEHESKFKHFNANNEPIKSFDKGYGMCQLTNPTPRFEQVWNWQMNVDGGLQLFEEKRKIARAYLGQNDRSYTERQLNYESICRWNGGRYHEWDTPTSQWIRQKHILCDSKTGNIGWDMNDPENRGKTEAELHKRDRDTYSRPPQPGAHWQYFGVCYADRILK
ncbi:MAG: hypothetical protein EOO88_42400 [Pedobacter sp.]|nr:MAG: hypothetical protein EOO88_42400 [Pedobacter sp.]